MTTAESTAPVPSIGSYLVDSPRFPFCKGCGHTLVVRKLNDALVGLQYGPDRITLVTDIGCIGLADALFRDIHTVHTTHGRSTAFATGIALADSLLHDGRLKVIVLIGDGGAMIGLQHLVHAAMLNVDVTVLICNNFVYGMTGGQGSGLTPECFVTATTPGGNIVPPVDLCGILKNSNASFVARTMATDPGLAGTIQRAVEHPGFSAVEILELCTEYAVPSNDLTGKKLTEIAAGNNWTMGWVGDVVHRPTFAERYRAAAKDGNGRQVRGLERKGDGKEPPVLRHPASIVVAGSAGERVQSSAATLCQAAVRSGLHITQKNDNPVTQGSGFSLSEVWLSPEEIHYTGIEQPDFVVVASEDGLRELAGKHLFHRMTPKSTVYLEATLMVPETDANYVTVPLRKAFGPEFAAMGGLALVALRHHLVDRPSLLHALESRMATEAPRLMSEALKLAESLPR